MRGGGDLATGTIHRLFRCGFPVCILETEAPSAIRRKAAFSEAVFHETATVEGVTARRISSKEQVFSALAQGEIPLLVDSAGKSIPALSPYAVIDAILAKRNLGTTHALAPITIALGPGFNAPDEVDAVVETMRGHHLGRVIFHGSAMPNTGVPGLINGFGKERVMHSPAEGMVRLQAQIGDLVEKGQVLAFIGDVPLAASLSGVLRGILPEGYLAHKGLKAADIDPRPEQKAYCDTISDKARCISGGVLEALMVLQREKKEAFEVGEN